MPAFLAPVNYAVDLPFAALGVGDFNGDAVLDLATANSKRADQDLYTAGVLLGNADGTFQPARTSANSTAGAFSMSVGDFNADGFDDLATSLFGNDAGYDVSVLLSNGNGTFRAPINVDAGPDVNTSLAVGDFNGDGKLDLAVTGHYEYYYHWTRSDVNVLLGVGDGSFSGPITSFVEDGYEPTSAVVGDFNGDGHQDMVVNRFGGGVLMLGDGQGHLASQGPVGNLGGGAVGDVNGDGKLDLVRAGSILLGDGAGGFPILRNYDTGGAYGPFVLGDFNGDRRLDIAMRPWESDNVLIVRGRGDGNFGDAEGFAAGQADEPGIAAGDFNGDGWLDAATRNHGGVSVLINNRSWPSPPPIVSVGDATVTEGNTGAVSATFMVTLSRASSVDVTVRYATANLSAMAGSDYTAGSGTVVIPAGRTGATITVAVTGDRLPEPTELFAVNLSSPTNATIADGQGLGWIVDNEPRISIGDYTMWEGRRGKTTTFTFTVTLSVPYDQPVTMSFSTVNGTATTGDNDYVAKAGTLTFAPGQTTKTITIVVNGDSRRESDEYFYLDLSGNSSNSVFDKKRGIGTIRNDD